MTTDWQGLIYLHADLTTTTNPPLTDPALLAALTADLSRPYHPATLHATYTKLTAELNESDVTAQALAFAGIARHLPTPSGALTPVAKTDWAGYQNAAGQWLNCVDDTDLDHEQALTDLLEGDAWALTQPVGGLGTAPLTDLIQVLTGGPLSEHPLRPAGLPMPPDVTLNTTAEQVLVLPPSALRGPHPLQPDQPVPHPDWPVLMEFQLPPGMIQPVQQETDTYGGRIAIHSMVVDADTIGWSAASPRPRGADRILVQAVMAEQAGHTDQTSAPLLMLGVTLRGLDSQGRPLPRITQLTLRGYEAFLPRRRWDAARDLWTIMTHDWCGIHVSLLRQLRDEWAQPITHVTPAGHAVRCVPDVPLSAQHANPDLLAARLDRLLGGLKRAAPQAWKRTPALFRQGVPTTADLLALLPEADRHARLGRQLLSVGVWRMTRLVYRIDETVLDAIWNDTEPPHQLPTTQLRYLPTHAAYIPLPGREDARGREVYGAFVTRVHGDSDEAVLIGVHTSDGRVTHVQIPVGSHVDVRAALEQAARLEAPDVDVLLPDRWGQHLILNILNVALYLCAVNADAHSQPTRTHTHDRKAGLPLTTITADVGVRMGAALRRASEAAADGPREPGGARTASMPGHVRRAHFHTYLYGPLGGERERRLKWLPPIPVNLEFGDDLPVTVHPVES